jgi:hypothetical protein
LTISNFGYRVQGSGHRPGSDTRMAAGPTEVETEEKPEWEKEGGGSTLEFGL